MSLASRRIGRTDIRVSPVGMGCWPISGMTSLDVNEQDSLATLHAALNAGVNFFDTAHMYGLNGESEQLIARAFAAKREQVVIATKAGIHWHGGEKAFDASAARLQKSCAESLARLQTDYVDLFYLHAPDPKIPIEESALAIKELVDSGKARSAGASNLTLDQLKRFQAVCPLSAYQPYYNMLQREIETEIVPWANQHGVSLMVYWPLLKGLLAGKLDRSHKFLPGDGRAKYAMFQGDEWQKNQDFVDDLRVIADDAGKTVSQLVVNWTVSQLGITVALCGAKRAYQIEETAGAMGWDLEAKHATQIEEALRRRGTPISAGAV